VTISIKLACAYYSPMLTAAEHWSMLRGRVAVAAGAAPVGAAWRLSRAVGRRLCRRRLRLRHCRVWASFTRHRRRPRRHRRCHDAGAEEEEQDGNSCDELPHDPILLNWNAQHGGELPWTQSSCSLVATCLKPAGQLATHSFHQMHIYIYTWMRRGGICTHSTMYGLMGVCDVH